MYFTPAHPPGPDIDAALTFLDETETIYGVEVDRTELERRLEALREYYANLADRLTAMAETDQFLGNRDYPDDHMYS